MFANNMTYKGLISKICKQYIQLSIKQTKKNQKMSGRTKQKFIQRRHTDGHQTHEKMLNIANY